MKRRRDYRAAPEDYDAAMRRLDSLRDIVSASDADEALERAIALANDLGFGTLGLSRVRPTVDGGAEAFIRSGSDQRTVRYIERFEAEALASVSSVTRKALAGDSFFDFSPHYADPKPAFEGDRFPRAITLARDLGFTASGGIAHRGAGSSQGIIVGLFDDSRLDRSEFSAALKEHESLLRLVLTALEHIESQAGPKGRARLLTLAQQKVLVALASGRRPEEIAAESGRSIKTVRRQMETARQRLGARTTIEAVMIAVQWGLIR